MSGLRASLQALANKSYFNYGGQGPLPKPSLEAIIKSWQKIQELGPFGSSVWPYIDSETTKTRNLLASICGIIPSRLTFTENVTSGCVLPLWGLPFNSEDRILISDSEHPGVMAACKELAKRLNLFIDIFPIQYINKDFKNQESCKLLLDSFEKKLKKKTRLVVISHILWNTGQIIPIEEISKRIKNHPNKPFLLVDGAQSFSHIPIEKVASVSDIFAFTGHKWALGPEGLGGAALSERILEESTPTLIGWKSLKNEHINTLDKENVFHNDSRRFEVGTSCIPLMAGLRSSLRILGKEGTIEQRLKKINELSYKLWKQLNQINHIQPLLTSHPPSGLVSFTIGGNIEYNQAIKFLNRNKIFLRIIEQPKCLRACVHLSTSEEEISFLVSNLRELLRE